MNRFTFVLSSHIPHLSRFEGAWLRVTRRRILLPSFLKARSGLHSLISVVISVIRQEIVEPISGLEMFHQDAHRNPRSSKHRGSAKDVRVALDQCIGHRDAPG